MEKKIDSRIHKIFWYEFLNEFLTELLNEKIFIQGFTKDFGLENYLRK